MRSVDRSAVNKTTRSSIHDECITSQRFLDLGSSKFSSGLITPERLQEMIQSARWHPLSWSDSSLALVLAGHLCSAKLPGQAGWVQGMRANVFWENEFFRIK